MSQQNQIHCLQATSQEAAEIIYIHEPDSESEEEKPEQAHELQISMHAIKGISIPKYTFILSVLVGNATATALVDSGCSATFMTPTFATRANCKMTPSKRLKVIVANGGILWT